MMMMAVAVVVITHQSVTVPRIFLVPVLFLGPIFSGTGSVITPKKWKIRYQYQIPRNFPVPVPILVLFQDQFFPVPVPGLFCGTKHFRYRYQPKRNKIPGTGMSHSVTNDVKPYKDVMLC